MTGPGRGGAEESVGDGVDDPFLGRGTEVEEAGTNGVGLRGREVEGEDEGAERARRSCLNGRR